MEKLYEKVFHTDKLSHAYLLVGDELLSFAKEIALQVNCEKSCGVCRTCQKIKQDKHPDVRIIRGENHNIGIDQIRELIKTAHLHPVESKKRIYIIDKVEDMSGPAANSFLKILESPPHYIIFILLASSLSNILPTITSRCQIVRIRGRSRAQLEKRLKGFNLNQNQLNYLGKLARVSPKFIDSLSKDEAYKLLREKEQLKIELEKARDQDLINLLDQERDLVKIFEVGKKILKTISDLPAYQILEIANKLEKFEEGELKFFLRFCLVWWRDLTFVRLGLQSPSKYSLINSKNGLSSSKIFSLGSVSKLIEAASEATWKLDRYANKKLLLEDLLFKMNQLP